MDKKTMYEITGEVDSIIYRNEENNYTVIVVNSGDTQLTAVGTLPSISSGEEVKLIGQYKSHPTYGEQFVVSACELSMPSSIAGIYKYLCSGAIKGVGPSRAERLVAEFGEKTLDVIENEPKRVAGLKGISIETAKDLSEQLKRVVGIRELILFLGRYYIEPQTAVLVWKKYGNHSIENIRQNPYLLCDEGIYVPFKTADKIAFDNQRESSDECRVRAGVIYVMLHNKNIGHTCLPKNKVISTSVDFLGVEQEVIEGYIDELVAEGTLVLDIIKEKEFLFLPNLYKSESYIAARLQMLLRFPSIKIPDADYKIESIEKEDNIEYAELQKVAIKQAIEVGLLILTGGPGTGKTTTLNAIIKILKQNGEKVLLAAPTGRAAQRMTALTGCEAKTIHRLLEVSWDNTEKQIFKRNEQNVLNCDALIIDEVSMVDSILFESVMKALPLGCRLILVGDSDQLPSVGAGNVLSDLIASGNVPVVALKEIFRQAMSSLIITNAHKIVNGQMPDLTVRNNDFFFIPANNTASVADTVVDLCSRRLPNKYGYSPLSDIQIIAPSRKGELGVNELNKRLQELLNPPSDNKAEITIGFNRFRVGDKVMQTKNNYDLLWNTDSGESGEGIFNGDVGILVEIVKTAQVLKIRYDDKVAFYDIESAMDLDLAYAVTVHKSQGNEFEVVVMPIFRGARQLMYRNLLYTAVTRAKKLIVIVGSADTIAAMVSNNKRAARYTALAEFIIRAKGNL